MRSFVFFDISIENLGIEQLIPILKSYDYRINIVHIVRDQYIFQKQASSDYIIEQSTKKILRFKPDYVGFSSHTDNFQICIKIAQNIKNYDKNIITIFGGPHPNVIGPKVLENKCVDFSFFGDAEKGLPQLLEAIDYNKDYADINNLAYRKNSKIYSTEKIYFTDFDQLPIPDRSFYTQNDYFLRKRHFFLTSRGCMFNCSYCSNNYYKKTYSSIDQYVRRRSPDNVIQELVDSKKKYGTISIHFTDDNFTGDYEWFRKFADLYEKKVDVDSDGVTHVDFISPQFIPLLIKIRCKAITLGVQTADEDLRKNVLRRHESNETIEKTFNLLREHNIYIQADHLFGIPGETFESIEYSIKSYLKWKPSSVYVNYLFYIPNTKIIEQSIEEGVISKDDIDDINQGKLLGILDPRSNFFKDKEKRIRYIRYNLLLSSIGGLPDFLILFFLRRLYLIPPFPAMHYFILFIKLFKLKRNNWMLFYLLFIFKHRIKFKAGFILHNTKKFLINLVQNISGYKI